MREIRVAGRGMRSAARAVVPRVCSRRRPCVGLSDVGVRLRLGARVAAEREHGAVDQAAVDVGVGRRVGAVHAALVVAGRAAVVARVQPAVLPGPTAAVCPRILSGGEAVERGAPLADAKAVVDPCGVQPAQHGLFGRLQRPPSRAAEESRCAVLDVDGGRGIGVATPRAVGAVPRQRGALVRLQLLGEPAAEVAQQVGVRRARAAERERRAGLQWQRSEAGDEGWGRGVGGRAPAAEQGEGRESRHRPAGRPRPPPPAAPTGM